MPTTTLSPFAVTEHLIPNNDGWLLHARQVVHATNFKKSLRPIVILPGYGMNAHIFSFHARGDSMERVFSEAGYEVWSLNLRWQGGSKSIARKPIPPTMRELIEIDVPAALDHILRTTQSRAKKVTIIGCSLGGTLAYGYMATSAEDRVGALIAMGSPLRWVQAPMALRLISRVPNLLRYVPTYGTQRIARYGFPVLAKVPASLSFYVNPENVDLSKISELVKTISDPHPELNADIGRWIQQHDLTIRGINVSEALSSMTKPLLVVWTARDAIVPTDTARSALELWGDRDNAEEFEVGHDGRWYGHADLFIGNDAKKDVFEPILQWLERHP